jgi:hypothetical protein
MDFSRILPNAFDSALGADFSADIENKLRPTKMWWEQRAHARSAKSHARHPEANTDCRKRVCRRGTLGHWLRHLHCAWICHARHVGGERVSFYMLG